MITQLAERLAPELSHKLGSIANVSADCSKYMLTIFQEGDITEKG
jgi:hypothetical protein